MIDAMIFSKNRPLQLNSLLESIKFFSNLADISVLYKYDDAYMPGLQKVKELHPDVGFLEEKDFESQVKSFLGRSKKFCVFFVDDILFKDQVDFDIPCQILQNNPSFLTFSLRLGTHLTYCYPTSSNQSVPNGAVNSGFFIWNWKQAEHDWGYPLSVDGHIFRRTDLESWTSHLRFKNPNQFESELQKIRKTFALPDGCVSYLNSKILNIPFNRVQNEFQNRSENVSIEELYDVWVSGKTFDFEKISRFLNNAAHVNIHVPFKDVKK